MPAVHADGAAITTVECLAAEDLRQAFVDEGAAQCGICTPGMIVAASAIEYGASPEAIRMALAGNLCRCTGYSSIIRAVQTARPRITRTHTR